MAVLWKSESSLQKSRAGARFQVSVETLLEKEAGRRVPLRLGRLAGKPASTDRVGVPIAGEVYPGEAFAWMPSVAGGDKDSKDKQQMVGDVLKLGKHLLK